MSEAASRILRGIKEIAAFIGESEDRTWRLLREGRLPAYQYGHKGPWRMRVSAYEDFVARERPGAVPQKKLRL